MEAPNSPGQLSVREIFLEALSKSTAAERQAYLDIACHGNDRVRAKVEALLRNHRDDNFLEGPAIVMEALERTDDSRSLAESPGTCIGRYKLLEQIGEGGFGVVFMAEQEEPVRRKVALKIIKLGMDTRQVVARFEAERQALALMDHTNIAKVLDGGATESGRPYFVMELEQGVPITEFCDKNHLSVEERIKLFIPVCQAIQSAHQKGIIHRDIKPSNVLVTLHDGVPVPKVIDFGVAKATNQKLTEKTLFTNFGTMIGTPAYMSPEQAEMSSLDVDTRSDIYSLGVLLYELLTGTTPFSEKRLRSVAYSEMQRIIVEEEPERPSTRLTRQLTIVDPAKSQTANPKSQIDPDLDWIVMKCLEKDRNRRYETANGLAADLKRHLSNEPVVARPPSAAYRFQKLVRRHRTASLAVAFVTLAVLLGAVVSTWALIRERSARAREQAARQEADRRLHSALHFANEIFTDVAPSLSPPGSAVQAREKLAKATLEVLTQLQSGAASNREVRVALAQGFLYLSQTQGAVPEGNVVGNYESALQRAREAEELFAKFTPDQLSAKEIQLLVLAKHFGANALQQLGRYQEAARTYKEAVSLLPFLERSAEHRDWARTSRAGNLTDAGFCLLFDGDPRGAEQELRAVLESEWSRTVTTNSGEWDIGVLATTYGQLMTTYDLLGDFAQMLWAATNGIVYQQVHIDRFPNIRNTANRGCLAGFQAQEAHGFMRLGQTNESLHALAQSRAAVDQLLMEDPQNEFARMVRVNIALNQARVFALWSDLPGTALTARRERFLRAQTYLAEAEDCQNAVKSKLQDPLLPPARKEVSRVREKLMMLEQQPEHPPPK